MKIRFLIMIIACLSPVFFWAQAPSLDASDTLRIKGILMGGLTPHADVRNIPRWERRTHKGDFGPLPRLRTVGDSLESWGRVKSGLDTYIFICGNGDRAQGYYITANSGGGLTCNFYWTASRLAIRMGLPIIFGRKGHENLRCVSPEVVMANFMDARVDKYIKKTLAR